jgi:spermidine/putrescine transport system permease protein
MLLPFVIVMVFLIILPLVTMVIYSFVESSNDALQFKSTFENFAKLFTNTGIMLALLYSIGFALIAAVFTVIFGYPIALIMSNLKSKILARNT